jgi:hypothetical protein
MAELGVVVDPEAPKTRSPVKRIPQSVKADILNCSFEGKDIEVILCCAIMKPISIKLSVKYITLTPTDSNLRKQKEIASFVRISLDNFIGTDYITMPTFTVQAITISLS